jgi:hypothetical protein
LDEKIFFKFVLKISLLNFSHQFFFSLWKVSLKKFYRKMIENLPKTEIFYVVGKSTVWTPSNGRP